MPQRRPHCTAATSLPLPLEQQDSLGSTAGRMEQLAGLDQSRVKLIDHPILQERAVM